jgi:CheY-like chemotaxis protein
MAASKILLVDDDDVQNIIMRSLLEREGFDITVAGNVSDALKLISSERYDVLLSDLHMPGAADGLTVISPMRHLNPKAIAVLLTGFPEMDVAAQAKERTRERVPLNWAGTQNNLGNALRALGEREPGTGRLEEAVSAHREALSEYTRERVPLNWAGTQSNLDNALGRLGERQGETSVWKRRCSPIARRWMKEPVNARHYNAR